MNDEETSEVISIEEDYVEKFEDGKIKCKRSQKDLFVVVQHSRKATECCLAGEVDDATNEIMFLLGNLNVEGNNLITRCLSAINLAAKLLDPTFRVHFFAYAPTGIFEVLKDAASDPNLSLCTAAVVLVLSTDNLKMDLDGSGLRLLTTIVEHGDQESGKIDKRVIDGVANVIAQSRFHEELPKSAISVRIGSFSGHKLLRNHSLTDASQKESNLQINFECLIILQKS